MKPQILSLFACLVLVAAAPAADFPEKAALQKRRAALTQAHNSRDVKKIGAFYHPSYKYTGLDGKVESRAQTLAKMERFFKRFPDVRLAVQVDQMEPVEGGVEIIVQLTARYTRNGEKVAREARVSETWKQVKGVWLLFKEQEL
jgi:nuclear transport factor 2 (NTF2) superfamily protein